MTPHKILVVDDDAPFLRFCTELLIGAGYDVRGTADPFNAVGLAEAFLPDLIILDLAIPGQDGLALATELSKNEKTASIPRMFLTATSAGEGRAAAQDAGAKAYLEKPVKMATLLWTIKTLLSTP